VLLNSTQLAKGFGIILDSGAIESLAGVDWVRRYNSDVLRRNRLKPKFVACYMKFHGVGKHGPQAKWKAELPIGIQGYPGTYNPYVLSKDGKGLPPLCSIKGMSGRGIIHDPANRIAIIPGEQPVKITVGKGGRIVKLVEAPSGHPLLPLDERFTVASERQSRKSLVPLTGSSGCTITEQTDDEEDEE